MLNIDTLILGAYLTNCYILRQAGNTACLLIDPGDKPQTVAQFLSQQALQPAAILLTHGHFDHVGAVQPLAQQYGCPVYLNEKETALPQVMTAGPLYYTHTYRNGDTLSLAELTVQVMETPGHTPGSVCLVVENNLFSGDTLFAGSCGRVDFPGSSPVDMRRSLTRLAALEQNYTVYPGHGDPTSLHYEQQTNPYMRGAL